MTNPAIVDSYLREQLADLFDDEVTVQDNTYTLPLDTQPRVRIVPATGRALRVEVAGLVAEDVTPGAELLATLNDLNARLPYGRVFLVDDVVVAEHTVLGEELTPALIDNAIRFVDWVVGFHGPDLVAEFGGTTVTQPQPHLPIAPDGAQPVEVEVHDAVRPVADRQPTPADAPEPVGISAAGYL